MMILIYQMVMDVTVFVKLNVDSTVSVEIIHKKIHAMKFAVMDITWVMTTAMIITSWNTMDACLIAPKKMVGTAKEVILYIKIPAMKHVVTDGIIIMQLVHLNAMMITIGLMMAAAVILALLTMDGTVPLVGELMIMLLLLSVMTNVKMVSDKTPDLLIQINATLMELVMVAVVHASFKMVSIAKVALELVQILATSIVEINMISES